MAVVPIICYAIVEWHPADRVARQFGMRQSIPNNPPNFDKLHKIDLRGKTDVYWPTRHQKWIAMWNNRQNQVLQGEQYSSVLSENSAYMDWYIPRTRRYISREGTISSGAVNSIFYS